MSTRYDITDNDRLPPHVRLCYKILRESLAQGVTAVELVGAGSLPVVNRHVDGTWQPHMQLPIPAFAALARQLRLMAGPYAGADPSRRHDPGIVRRARCRDRPHRVPRQ